MTSRIKLSLLTLTSVLGVSIAACETGSYLDEGTESPKTGERSQAATTLTFDTTAIATHPLPNLPETPLRVSAFSIANVQRGLVQSDEKFGTEVPVGAHAGYDSASWHAEIDPTRGQVLAVSQLTPGTAVAQSDRTLESLALRRLEAFGIPAAEIGSVWQRRSMLGNEDDGVYTDPAIDGYKTFAIRGINGVRIRGHRAVVTVGQDGVFRRALVKWPALAASGHKLRTGQSTSDIVALATRALGAQGITSGAITLEWEYVPTEQKTGEITLTLVALAKVPFDASLGEARQVEVDVSAS